MPKEQELYPIVKKYFERKYSKYLLASRINSGLIRGKADVLIVRGIYAELSNDVEIISVEVKPNKSRFLNYIGQALGYSIFSDRCYLAILGEFDQKEIDIASRLGVGLIEIKNNSCKEILSSQLFSPIESLKLDLLSKLDIFRCAICNSFVNAPEYAKDFANAVREGKHYMYWLFDQDDLMCQKGLEKRKHVYVRRLICKDCIKGIFKNLE